MKDRLKHRAHSQRDILRALEAPAYYGGIAIQALAARHARLLIRMNIWQRPAKWGFLLLHPIRNRAMIECFALRMYSRVLRRYGIHSPLPCDTEPIDPMWLDDPVPSDDGQETEQQALARILSIASFFSELSFAGYSSKYVLAHVDRWNRRLITEHRGSDERERKHDSSTSGADSESP